MKRFYLSGQNNFGNRGCEALMRSTLELLNEEFGEVDVLVPRFHPDLDGKQWPDAEINWCRFVRAMPYCDSGMIPWLLVTELFSRSGKHLSQVVGERIKAYPCSGEINYRVSDLKQSIEHILQHYLPMNTVVDRTDGVSAVFAQWRFNLHGSNTEPLLRLNVESRGDIKLIEKKTSEIESLIKQ